MTTLSAYYQFSTTFWTVTSSQKVVRQFPLDHLQGACCLPQHWLWLPCTNRMPAAYSMSIHDVAPAYFLSQRAPKRREFELRNLTAYTLVPY